MNTPSTVNVGDAVHAVRERAGIWSSESLAFVRVSGPDAASWLNAQTTNDVAVLSPGMGHAGAMLERKGRLTAFFTLHRWGDEFWLILDKACAPALFAQLGDHHFSEDVSWSDAGDDLDQLVVQGPRSVAFLAGLDGGDLPLDSGLPADLYGVRPVAILRRQALAFRLSLTGEDGYLFAVRRGEGPALLHDLLKRGEDEGVLEVPAAAREILRIEAGLPRYGVDLDASNRPAETPLEREAVSTAKGCYIGQEVTARLRAYGSPKQSLMGLLLDETGAAPPAPGAELLCDGRRVGRVTSSASSPTLARPLALAYLDRGHRVPGSDLDLVALPDNTRFRARVVSLPFIRPPTRQDRARRLYDQALTRFERDARDVDRSVVQMLHEAVLLAPGDEDIYEALGVVLHRQGRTDEAIRVMQALARLRPDSVMAHTNLSVFYAAKGLRDEAEREKAVAAGIEIRQAGERRKAAEIAEVERDRLRRDARERIRMFREILEIEPDDPLAVFGMGMAHAQLEDHVAALPWLERAVDLQEDYSAGLLNLGKCHEALGHIEEARQAYTRGIAAAARKGDLMPLREMERRLVAIDPAPSAHRLT